jgi:hypothetical protein
MKTKLQKTSYHLWMAANVVYGFAAVYYSRLWWKLAWWSVLNGVLIFSALVLYGISYFTKDEAK